MSNNINLLKGGREKRYRQEKLLRILRVVSLVSFSLVVVSSALLFYINTRFPVESLRQEESAAATIFTSLKGRAEKLLFTKNRVQDIVNVTKKRTVFDNIIAEITRVVPADIQIKSFNLDKKKFTLTIVSPSLISVNAFIEGIDSLLENKKILSKVILDGLTADPKNGSYTILLSGDFP